MRVQVWYGMLPSVDAVRKADNFRNQPRGGPSQAAMIALVFQMAKTRFCQLELIHLLQHGARVSKLRPHNQAMRKNEGIAYDQLR